MNRVGRAALPLAIAALILRLTLPAMPGPHLEISRACILCGERGIADAILNIALFVPLGFTLTFWMGAKTAVLIGLLFTVGIESAQVLIPGRFPTLGDVLFNTAGCALGSAFFATRASWLWPSRMRSGWLSFAAATAASIALLTGAYLIAPAPIPPGPVISHITPRFRSFAVYQGSVLSAHLNGKAIIAGRPPVGPADTHFLPSGGELAIRLVVGPQPGRLAPVVAITDDSSNELLFMGIDGADLVFRTRLRSVPLGLTRPGIRAAGALQALRQGDLTTITIARRDRDYCIGVARTSECGFGFHLLRSWSLLYYPSSFSLRTFGILDFVWLGLLVVPFWYWARKRLPTVLGVGLLSVTLIAGQLFPNIKPVPWSLLLLGVPCSWLLGTFARRVSTSGVSRWTERSRLSG